MWLVDEFDRPLGLVLEVVNFSISLERVLVVITPKIVITFPGPMRSITAKQNHIGSVVSVILRYTHTQIEILLLYYEDVSESQSIELSYNLCVIEIELSRRHATLKGKT